MESSTWLDKLLIWTILDLFNFAWLYKEAAKVQLNITL